MAPSAPTIAPLSSPPDERGMPEYEPHLAAFHRAFASELRQAVQELPLPPDAHVLDLACGDGFYTAQLANRLGPRGLAVAVDLLDGYLERARGLVRSTCPNRTVAFSRADAYRLPFADDRFDLTFCAQSLISLDDAGGLLRAMRRVSQRGGLVVVLETDEYHHVLLPWPVELEVALQRAVLAGCRQRFGEDGKLSPSRWLRQQLQRSGLVQVEKRTISADRLAPFSAEVREFLRHYFRFLADLVRDHLSPPAWAAFARLTDEDQADSLLNCSDGELTCLITLYLARKT